MGIIGGVLIRGGVGKVSKMKVIIARSTGVHIALITMRMGIGENGLVRVHIMVHGVAKVSVFIGGG